MNKMKTAILGSILMFLLSFNAIPSLSAEPDFGGGRISLIQVKYSSRQKMKRDGQKPLSTFQLLMEIGL